MTTFSSCTSEFVIYPFHNQLFFQRHQGNRCGHPVILCQNYSHSLTCTSFHSQLFYAYCDPQFHSHLYSRMKQIWTFTDPAFSCHQILLCPFQEHFLLFLLLQDLSDHTFQLRCYNPLNDPTSFFVFPDRYFSLPAFSAVPFSDCTLITLFSEDLQSVYRYDLHDARPLTDAKEILAEKERSENALRHTNLLLDRAKQQYEELMQVATLYREEALKWRQKFL